MLMQSVVLLVSIQYGGGPAHNYSIPGFSSTKACEQAQPAIEKQLLNKPFSHESMKALPTSVKTQCVGV